MALAPPEKKWWRALGKDERIWSWIILLMILMMSIMTVGYVFVGDQNPPERFNRLTPEEFQDEGRTSNQGVGTFTQTSDGNELDVTGSSTDSIDVYLFGQGGRSANWKWQFLWNESVFAQTVILSKDQTYSFHISGDGALHGFELLDFSLSIQIVPGYDYIVDFIPETTGTFVIICNEYCGPGHHTMAAVMEVV
jgi:cytochrome c oxidase subunit 2